jgi:hypothetical protein
MHLSDLHHRILSLHESPYKAVIACTGAGAGIQKALWEVPGSSETIIDSVFPYHRLALTDFIGREPAKFCSQDTALWMATAAHRRATELVLRDGGDPATVIGLALTAAVATNRPKKGDHQCFIAVRTAKGMSTVSAVFEKGLRSREEEGALCDLLAVNVLLASAGLEQVSGSAAGILCDEIRTFDDDGDVLYRPKLVPSQLAPLAGTTHDIFDRPLFQPDGARMDVDALSPDRHILFHGSFDPWHFGHDLMAQQAERMTGKEVVCAITATHPDKGRLGEAELLRRAEQFRYRRPVLFMESGALYVDKARMFPGVGMLIGADVALGILNPKYYGSPSKCMEALEELRQHRARFYVVGREIEGKFVTLDDLPIPAAARELFLPVSGRWDVRSRDLRK